MNKEKKKVSIWDIICVLLVLILPWCLLATNIIQDIQYRELQYKYSELQQEHQEVVYECLEEFTYYERDLARVETENEWLEKLYEELKVERDSAKYDIKKVMSDVDDCMDYYMNWTAYIENNPDVTFEQFLIFKDPNLYQRMLEYGR